MRIRHAIATAVAVLALPAPAVARQIAEPARSTTLAARGAVLAYSDWDEAIGAYRLRVAVGERAPADVAVAPRSVPFDVRVGRVGGRAVLVYSRCAQEPPALGDMVEPEPYWWSARDCTLYTAGLDGHEHAIRGAGPGVLPAVSGATLAFVRFAGRTRATVIVRRFDRPGPPARRISVGRRTPVELDLLGHRLAVTSRVQGSYEVEDSVLSIIDTRTGRGRSIHRLHGGGLSAHYIVGTSLLPRGAVAWAEICGGDPSGCPGNERIDHWTPIAGLRESQSPGIQAFAETPFATWRLEGCSANVDDPSPCVLSRS